MPGIFEPPGASKLLEKYSLLLQGGPKDEFTVCFSGSLRFLRF